MINEKLRQLYLKSFDNMLQMQNELENIGLKVGKDYGCPLFMYCWEEEYTKLENKKILFVGQEYYAGWYLSEYSSPNDYKDKCDDFIDGTIKKYENFGLGESYSSYFWSFIKKVNKKFNAENATGKNILWTNINKFGRATGKGRPDRRVIDAENKYLVSVFKDELDIIKPDVVIFLTGPYYDEDIKNKIGTYKKEQIFRGCFDRIISDCLPEKSFRIYHPNYLHFHPKYRNEILDGLVSYFGENF